MIDTILDLFFEGGGNHFRPRKKISFLHLYGR